MKRRTVLVGAAVLAVLCVGVGFWRPWEPREPSYRGKTLRAWLDDLHTTPGGQVVLSDEAVAAVRGSARRRRSQRSWPGFARQTR